MIILIPAYEPDHRLVDLVEAIRRSGRPQPIVVVDDGSGPGHRTIFTAVRRLGCDVIVHDHNRGKGAALKTGFAHIANRYPGHDVVTADCDGQHTLVDIVRVADLLCEHRGGIALGARQFSGDVPARSRFGNTVTRRVFRVATGIDLTDTQTGLRGYPAWMLSWLLDIGGDRFEYELEVLLAAKRMRFELNEVPIDTIYLDGNESSHFRPVRDSLRVYLPFVRFSASSLSAFAIDATLFFVLMATLGNLAVAVVTARVVSASCNFAMNRRLVFRARRRHALDGGGRYAVLAAALMIVNYVMIGLLMRLGVGVVVAKLVTESTLFLASYHVQRSVVFRPAVAMVDAPAARDHVAA